MAPKNNYVGIPDHITISGLSRQRAGETADLMASVTHPSLMPQLVRDLYEALRNAERTPVKDEKTKDNSVSPVVR